jgi:hypothetical protein
MFCKYCGSKLTDDAKFCGKCGKEVGNTTLGSEKAGSSRADTAKSSGSLRNNNYAKAILIILVLGGLIVSVTKNIGGVFGNLLTIFGVLVAIKIGIGTLKTQKNAAPSKPSNPQKSSPIRFYIWVSLLVLGIVVVLALVSNISTTAPITGSSSQTDQWKAYTAPDGSFTISFPVEPIHNTADSANGNIHCLTNSYISAPSTNVDYLVGVTTCDTLDTSDPNTLLRIAATSLASRYPQSKLSTQYGSFNGLPAIDLVLDDKTGKSNIKGKIVLSQQTVYVVYVNGAQGSYSDTDYNQFIASWHLFSR